jgi:hypothetical protein
MPIIIKKSPTADTRSCDPSTVTLEQLGESTKQHISDVSQGMGYFADLMKSAGSLHDRDKLETLNEFWESFRTNKMKDSEWLQKHYVRNRHHLTQAAGIPADVNLIDLLEYLTDCVMAGMARSGEIFDLNPSPELLVQAFQNTVKLLRSEVQVEE